MLNKILIDMSDKHLHTLVSNFVVWNEIIESLLALGIKVKSCNSTTLGLC